MGRFPGGGLWFVISLGSPPQDRLENFGVTVEMLSRFITSKKRKEIINNITKDGNIILNKDDVIYLEKLPIFKL